MTAPQPDQQQQQNHDRDAIIALLVLWFGSSAAVSAVRLPANLVRQLVASGLSEKAVRAAARITMAPALTGRRRGGSPTPRPGMTAARTVASEEPQMRAQYLVKASERLTEADQNGVFPQALRLEEHYLDQHTAAGRNRARAAAALDQVATEHGPYVVWLTRNDARVEADCRKLSGTVFTVDDPPLLDGKPVIPGAVHPHCFPAGVVVSGPGVLAGTVRWYQGELVEIRTAFGHVLPVTPNHPVLTSEGWIAACLLVKGAQVLRDVALESVTSSHPHDRQDPARIEDVAGALLRAGRVTPGTMPMTAEDFHGDGSDGEVDVVWADRLLRDRLQVGQPLGQQQFGGAGARRVALTAGSYARAVLDRMALAPESFMRRGGVGGVLLGGSAGDHQLVRGGVVADRDSLIRDPSGQRHPGDPEIFTDGLDALASPVAGKHECAIVRLPPGRGTLRGLPMFTQHSADRAIGGSLTFRDAPDALPGLVALDEVIEVRRNPSWSGHVHNLETSGGWYTANNIIVHNCRCRAVGLFDRSQPAPVIQAVPTGGAVHV